MARNYYSPDHLGTVEDAFDEPICKCMHYQLCHRWVFPEGSGLVTSGLTIPRGSYHGRCDHCSCSRFQYETTHEKEAERAKNERTLYIVLAVAAFLLFVMMFGLPF